MNHVNQTLFFCRARLEIRPFLFSRCLMANSPVPGVLAIWPSHKWDDSAAGMGESSVPVCWLMALYLWLVDWLMYGKGWTGIHLLQLSSVNAGSWHRPLYRSPVTSFVPTPRSMNSRRASERESQVATGGLQPNRGLQVCMGPPWGAGHHGAFLLGVGKKWGSIHWSPVVQRGGPEGCFGIWKRPQKHQLSLPHGCHGAVFFFLFIPEERCNPPGGQRSKRGTRCQPLFGA